MIPQQRGRVLREENTSYQSVPSSDLMDMESLDDLLTTQNSLTFVSVQAHLFLNHKGHEEYQEGDDLPSLATILGFSFVYAD